MTAYTVRPIAGRNPWLVKPRPQRGWEIRGVMIHATRSGATAEDYDDLRGTENWAMSPNNGSAAQGWGAYWDELVGRYDGTRIVSTDWDREYASWCAGYGGDNTWAAGIFYIQIEVAQARVDQPYTEVQIDSLAQSVAEKSRRYAFPIERIPYLTQQGEPPRGICTHEDSANGRNSGKSDPGPLFPWDDFLARARRYAGQNEEDDMTPDQLRLLVALGEVVAGTVDSGNVVRDLADRVAAEARNSSLIHRDTRLNTALTEIRANLQAHIASHQIAGDHSHADLERLIAAANAFTDALD